MALTWCPSAVSTEKKHLLSLPNELLLLIIENLPDPYHLLLAFPALINVSTSLLETLEVSSNSNGPSESTSDIDSWLDLLHEHPSIADRIQTISAVFCDYRSHEYAEDEEATKKQQQLSSDSKIIERPKACRDDAKFALLLLVAPNVRNIRLELRLKYSIDLKNLSETLSHVFTVLRSRSLALDTFSIQIEADSVFGSYVSRVSGCRSMASLISTIFKLPDIKVFNISGKYVEAQGSEVYWPASLHPPRIRDLAVNNLAGYRPSFVPRMLRCMSGLRRFDCEISKTAVSESPDGYKLYERALRPHKDTLISLRLIMPEMYETQRMQPFWMSQQPSICSLQDFHKLKRLEVSPCVLWDAYDIGIASPGPAGDPETMSIDHEHEYAYPHMAHLELHEILPLSLHNFCVTWMDVNVSQKLQSFVQHLADATNRPFSDLAHLCDLCDFDRATTREQAEELYVDFIPEQEIQQLMTTAQDLSIATFPEDSSCFGRVPFVPDLGIRKRIFPQTVYCMGECC